MMSVSNYVWLAIVLKCEW